MFVLEYRAVEFVREVVPALMKVVTENRSVGDDLKHVGGAIYNRLLIIWELI